jgi:hypothetical protein
MRAFALLAALATVLGCSGEPTRPTYDYVAYAGTWRMVPEPIGGCITEDADFWFTVVPIGDADSGSDPILNTVSRWGYDPEMSQDYILTGHLDLERQAFKLVLWRVGVRSEFRGRIESPTRISGTWEMPENFFNTFPCATTAVATH